ncbi:MAG: 4Fe-4S dicluster domain-containing protein [Lentisphaeria bacterium]|nr:4Fe-4S dicluster domain-containing protein [Lentisphaeria bacterium]
MIKIALARLHQRHRTMKYPAGPPPELPDRLRGLPVLDRSACPPDCRACADACPVGAIGIDGTMRLDLGKCLFCDECVTACPHQAIRFGQDYRLSTRLREDLVIGQDKPALELAESLAGRLKSLLGRSLKLRQVSAGGCNACEADVNVLNTLAWDLGRFGIQMVASPRHADGLLITGPVTQNMKLALRKTYDAVPEPKIVICVGACAISGGPFIDHAEACNGAGSVVPVDLHIAGCPPHPLTILDGLLRLLGKNRD